MKPKIPSTSCLAVGIFFGLLLETSGDGGLAREGSEAKQCLDVNGLSVQSGESYTPGPDYCTVCKCEDGSPKFCRAVLCQPRPDCNSFRVGTTCCDFICLDDVLPNRPGGHPIGRLPDGTHYPAGGSGIIPHIHENGENSLGMRLAAAILTALMAFVLLLFLVHRLRQRRITAQQYVNAQDVACCHPAAYWHNSDQAALFLQPPHWKPPSCVVDAPPPYTEADAQRAAARAVFSDGSVAAMPSSAPPSYSGPAHLLPFSPPEEGATALPYPLEGTTETVSRDSILPHSEPRSTDPTGTPVGGMHLPPASLGPLAVQLLPAASNSADLREQIQRQRRNLMDHSTRSLPRASHPFAGSAPPVSPGRVMARHCTLARPSGSDAASREQAAFSSFEVHTSGSPEAEVTEIGALKIEDPKVEDPVSLQQEEPLEISLHDGGEETGVSDLDEVGPEIRESNTGSTSIVRKSVLKFEAAAAALEASDAHSGDSNSPVAMGLQHSPSRPMSSPHRKPDLLSTLTGHPLTDGSHSPHHTAFHFPSSHVSSLREFTYRGEAPFGGHIEDEAVQSCTRQPLLPRDTSSPDRGAKHSRRWQQESGRSDHFCAAPVGNHSGKAKNKASDVSHHALGDGDSEGNEVFGYSDVGVRNMDSDLQSFRASGRRAVASAGSRRPETTAVSCASGARNRI